ncbi:MAG: hypothetical protein KC996_08070 [Phycisphaerales bacterium]|nr:hypothetical protein [Phycisphaerales bacterium]
MRLWIALCGLCAAGSSCFAQLAPLTEAATQPAKGRITWRQSFSYTEFDLSGRTIEQAETSTNLSYGITGELSASLTFSYIGRNDTGGAAYDQDGFGDTDLRLKWRFWQHDPGAISTNRLALVGGVRLPTGTDGLSSGGYDPYLGVTFTRVEGRHGLNASAFYRLTTDGQSSPIEAGMGSADLLTLETSYLYRLSPAEYASDTEGSLYAVLESVADYETNGDFEWRLAPGILWEAKRYALELSVILPAVSEVDARAETDWGLNAGFRVLF